jgi:hypothetical protein
MWTQWPRSLRSWDYSDDHIRGSGQMSATLDLPALQLRLYRWFGGRLVYEFGIAVNGIDGMILNQ